MAKKVFLLLTIYTFLTSCTSPTKNAVREDLMIEIEKYITAYEKEASLNQNVEEHSIYIVNFTNTNDSCFVSIFENLYYVKDGLDGYLKIGDNLVAFYNTDNFCNSLVDKRLLTQEKLIEYNDEDSEIALEATYDPKISTYKIVQNKLRKINGSYR